MKVEEIRIPAPWGHIAAKTYGEESNPIAIVVHGILENSASFDNLIPLLPNQFHYVCIDLPGHGFSSSFTKGLPVYFEFFTYAIKITMDYFKRDQYILIGHNFGAAVSAFASQIYHDCVSKLVLIDATTLWPKTPTRFAQRLKTAIDTVESSTEEKKTQTYAEVKKNVMRNRLEGVITSEAADLLMKRMVRKVGNDQYVLNHDENINTIIYPSFHFDDIKNMATMVPVRCDGILINYTNASQKHLEYQEKTSKLFPVTRIMVKGHHSYHMTNPDSVAPIISSFLLAPPVRSKL